MYKVGAETAPKHAPWKTGFIFNRGRSTGRVFRSAQWQRFNFTGSWSALYLIGDAAVGYFVPLKGPLNGHPPSCINSGPNVNVKIANYKTQVIEQSVKRQVLFTQRGAALSGSVNACPIYIYRTTNIKCTKEDVRLCKTTALTYKLG